MATPDATTLEPYGVPHLGPVAQLDAMHSDVGYAIGIGSPQVLGFLDDGERAGSLSRSRRAGHRARPWRYPTATYSRAVSNRSAPVVE